MFIELNTLRREQNSANVDSVILPTTQYRPPCSSSSDEEPEVTTPGTPTLGPGVVVFLSSTADGEGVSSMRLPRLPAIGEEVTASLGTRVIAESELLTAEGTGVAATTLDSAGDGVMP